MEVVPVVEADLGRLFRDEMSPTQIQEARGKLVGAAERLKVLAEVSGARAGWTGGGLDLATLASGQTAIEGFVEPAQASFIVELRPPHYFGSTDDVGWAVEAGVFVRCDGATDCGMHQVLSVANAEVASAEAAVDALVLAVEHLCQIAGSEPFGVWRERDPHRGHG